MIHCTIENAKKEQRGTDWWVFHPSNGAILAYCNTEQEADEVIAALNNVSARLATPSRFTIVWAGSNMHYIRGHNKMQDALEFVASERRAFILEPVRCLKMGVEITNVDAQIRMIES